MKLKTLVMPLIMVVVLTASAGFALADKGSGGSGGDENRVRIEIRDDEEDPEENRVRVEVRGDEANLEEVTNLVENLNLPENVDRVRVEARDDENRIRIEARDEMEEELPDIEIQGNTFEVTGEVTVFTGDAVTVGGISIMIDPSVANFEQEGTIEVGEVIKVEGTIEDGVHMAREIKANLEQEEMMGSGFSLENALNQIVSFLKSLMMT